MYALRTRLPGCGARWYGHGRRTLVGYDQGLCLLTDGNAAGDRAGTARSAKPTTGRAVQTKAALAWLATRQGTSILWPLGGRSL